MEERKRSRRSIARTARAVVDELLRDPARAQRLARTLGRVQRGKERFDKSQEELLRAAQLATRSDYKAVSKRLVTFKRQVRQLDERVTRLLTVAR